MEDHTVETEQSLCNKIPNVSHSAKVENHWVCLKKKACEKMVPSLFVEFVNNEVQNIK